MQAARWLVGSALAVASLGTAAEGAGLAVHSGELLWPRWQGRLFVDTATPVWRSDLANGSGGGLKVRGLALMGDYYFATLPLGDRGAGGFRATSGLWLGSQRAAFPAMPPDGAPAPSLIDRHDHLRFGSGEAPDAATDTQPIPYVGIGYSGLTGRSGWGFAADVGVMALGSGAGLRPGSGQDSGQNADDLLRDLRMTPVIKLGISYSF